MLPPTATLYCVLANPLTVIPCVAYRSSASELAAPSSPDDTNTEIPSAAAAWYVELYAALAVAPFSVSLSP